MAELLGPMQDKIMAVRDHDDTDFFHDGETIKIKGTVLRGRFSVRNLDDPFIVTLPTVLSGIISVNNTSISIIDYATMSVGSISTVESAKTETNYSWISNGTSNDIIVNAANTVGGATLTVGYLLVSDLEEV